ncbi:polysaccharide biosynthesis tyrosine autokinase [Neomicrococcus aestuarii]|uniref:non-specific protein-tyrosine kinase n=1 Tax=Neomicrococcus aestuarii TaxID=556325 RepID=A0A1L2ZMV4_9MICC|nr:polysaccharide biosynthesis tyrosine autokinase [Neomicrococcus aestuarii]APF40469.1 hypothetical protein BHE16_04910 [Neomicrococcus aestuarii]
MEYTAENQPQALNHQVRRLAHVVLNNWKGAIAIFLLAVLASVGLFLISPKTYAATNTVMVVAGGGNNLGSYLSAETLANTKAETYLALGNAPEVSQLVSKHFAEEGQAVSWKGVTFTKDPSNSQIRVTATAENPEHARASADAFASALAEEAERVERVMATGGTDSTSSVPVVQIIPISSALLPSAPSAPVLRTNLMYGAIAGLILAALFVFIKHLFDVRIRSTEQVETTTGHPVLGTVPQDKRLDHHRQVITVGEPGDKQGWATSEALRELRTNLTFSRVDNPPRIIVVTSALAGEGKSSIAANLAVTIAQSGSKVILIDADLRRSVQTDIFQLQSGAGLTDLLSGAVDLDDVLQEWSGDPRLQVLGAGRVPPNPSELLGSRAMKRLLTDLAQESVVIVDSPPLLPVTDASVLSTSADGVLVVARAGSTSIEALKKATDRLDRVNGHVLGVVLNQVPRKGSSAGQYGYYSDSYYYTSTDGQRTRRQSGKRRAASSSSK